MGTEWAQTLPAGGPRAEHDAGAGAPAAGGGDSPATPGSSSGGSKHDSEQKSVCGKLTSR